MDPSSGRAEQLSYVTRTVIVNVNAGGKVHELTCRWLIGALNSGLNASSYKKMRADTVPAGKKHCLHC